MGLLDSAAERIRGCLLHHLSCCRRWCVVQSDTVQRIAELVDAKQLDGITDVRDESDRTGEVTFPYLSGFCGVTPSCPSCARSARYRTG
jgi:hypothetical protein